LTAHAGDRKHTVKTINIEIGSKWRCSDTRVPAHDIIVTIVGFGDSPDGELVYYTYPDGQIFQWLKKYWHYDNVPAE
jgi:hypothetical protein